MYIISKVCSDEIILSQQMLYSLPVSTRGVTQAVLNEWLLDAYGKKASTVPFQQDRVSTICQALEKMIKKKNKELLSLSPPYLDVTQVILPPQEQHTKRMHHFTTIVIVINVEFF